MKVNQILKLISDTSLHCSRRSTLSLWTSALVLYGAVMPIQLLHAQDEAPTTAAAAGDDENIYINFVREQLARSRQVAASETAAPKEGNGRSSSSISPDAMSEEEQKILAQEAELLKELSLDSSKPSEARMEESTEHTAAAESAPAHRQESAKASVDVERALDGAASANQNTFTAEDDFIEIVRPLPSTSERAIESRRVDVTEKREPVTKIVTDPALQQKIASQQQNINTLQKSNGDLRRTLQLTQKQLREKTAELEKSRNRLLIAETEVERLSSIIEQRNKTSLAKFSGASKPATHPSQTSRSYPVPAKPEVKTSSASPSTESVRAKAATEAPSTPDMLIATVMVQKAYLRTGPGKNNSPLMSVGSGTRLAVETRQGDWYRVITPHGTRAWIASEVIGFGPDSSSSPSRTINVQGYAEKK